MEEERAKGKPKTKTKSTAILTQVRLGEQKHTWRWPKFGHAGRGCFLGEMSTVQVVEAFGDAEDAEEAGCGGLRRQDGIVGSAMDSSSKPPLISIQLSDTVSGAISPAQTSELLCSAAAAAASDDDGASKQADPIAAIGASAAAIAIHQRALATAKVDDVRRNFIALIRYNKLQYIYLGTFIYSVMNIVFIFYNAHLMASWGQLRPAVADSAAISASSHMKIVTNQPSVVACGDNYNQQVNSNSIKLLSINNNSSSEAPSSASKFHGLLEIALPVLVCLLALIAAIRALMFDKHPPETRSDLINARHPLDGARTALKQALRRKLAVLIQSSGLIVIILLLCLPIILLNLSDSGIVISPANRQASDVDDDSASNQPAEGRCDRTKLSIKGAANASADWFGAQPVASSTTILALIYLQPLLLEGGSIFVRLFGAFAILPAIILGPLRFLWLLKQQEEQQQQQQQLIVVTANNYIVNQTNAPSIKTTATPNQTLQWNYSASDNSFSDSQGRLAANLDLSLVVLGCLPLFLFFGMLKRRQYAHAIDRSTFSDASQLIEAKVSLEHQRQQQETLLLSVLPAYVAEQVKRNMLKKTTATTMHSKDMDTQEHVNAMGTCLQASSWPTPVQQTSSAVASTEPKPANQDPLASQQQQQAASSNLNSTSNSTMEQRPSGLRSTSVASATSFRNSFILSTRFTTSLVSGATFISGTLGGQSANRTNTHPLPSSSRNQFPGAAAAGGNNSHLMGFHQPASNFPAQISVGSTSTARRGFNELYIRTYNNVSLLYGDIVGFTRLCTQLSSSQLVRVLNDLFSHFDHLAEKHKIMRIKILGDCYYGVSGIPEFAVMGSKSRASRNENHAINCVNMGLDMIHYIRCLNVERASNGGRSTMLQQALSHSISASAEAPGMSNLNSAQMAASSCSCSADESQSASSATVGQSGDNRSALHSTGCKSAGNNTPMPAFELNMRIGVHSGHIHSGVIGLKKWQFDVWSNDVSIAMHCESSGVPGRVQVTEATVLQLNGAFTYEIAPENARDSFLADKEIRTYLISDRIKRQENTLRADHLPTSIRRPSHKKDQQQMVAKRKKQSVVQRPLDVDSIDKEALLARGGGGGASGAIHDCNMDEDNIRAATIGTIRQTLLAGESASSSSALAFYGLIFNHHDMTPFMLNYRDPAMNKLYANRPINRWLRELTTIILLLAVLIPLLNWQLLVTRSDEKSAHLDYNAQVKFLLLIALISTVLMIASFKAPNFCVAQRHKIAANYPIDNRITSSKPRFNDRPQLNNTHQVINDKGRCGKGKSLSNLGKSMIDIYWSMLKAFERLTNRLQSIESVRRLKLKTGITILMFFTVITYQAHLIIIGQRLDQSCGRLSEPDRDNYQNSQRGDRYSFIENRLSSEQYQLTVIILLISLDSSANLLSFKTKSIIIASIVCLQILPFAARLAAGCNLTGVNNDQLGNENARSIVDNDSSKRNNQQVPNWTSNALLFVMALWSLAFARQLEYTSRSNFLWRIRLNVDHEELEYISGINKVLLENILPSHVVQHYLTNPNGQQTSKNQLPNLQPYMRMSFSNMRNLNNDELYHEQHDSVAVMFASIPHFYEFYDESDISKQGLGCIALLNEIICDFDKLLLKNKFSRIEKIKTIGSTYMAAAGLRPSYFGSSRTSNASQMNAPLAAATSQQSINKNRNLITQTSGSSAAGSLADAPANAAGQIVGSVSLGTDLSADDKRLVIGRQKLNLICMVQFATNLMTALNGINKQSFQVFKLRVGVNAGPVIAGVIGAQRPFYDIWGDCVNIASRMESMGQVGRIQVEEKTAKLLQESLCSETYSIVRRGTINVKGKGGMVTYFVDKKAATSAAGNAIGASGLVDRLERKNSATDRQATMQPNESQTSTT